MSGSHWRQPDSRGTRPTMNAGGKSAVRLSAKRKPPLPIRGDWQRRFLQRRASFQTRKGHCNTLNCCIILSINRFRFRKLCSAAASGRRGGVFF
ncbi:hypothetical protein ELH72_15985 [Rhizobium ruizarguesonis]|nr:hypothetical protein ELH72_15985 [Rhizobium ruizarguesonis]